jgi:hypothetical protein
MQGTDPNWINVASVFIALFALIVSTFGFATSRKALRISQKQEQRKNPLLVPSLLNGYVQFRKNKERVYGFLLSVSNPSDSNNAIARIDLHLTYLSPRHDRLTVQVPSSTARDDSFSRLSEFTMIAPPMELDAHHTIAGWCVFRVPEAALSRGVVESTVIVLVDSHGLKASLEPVLVQEYRDEAVPTLQSDAPS